MNDETQIMPMLDRGVTMDQPVPVKAVPAPLFEPATPPVREVLDAGVGGEPGAWVAPGESQPGIVPASRQMTDQELDDFKRRFLEVANQPSVVMVHHAAEMIAGAERTVLGVPVDVACSAIEPCESCRVFGALADAADAVAPESDLPRLRIARRLVRATGQHSLAALRLVWATHVLTGPVLARMTSTFGYQIRADEGDMLSNFVMFCRDPGDRVSLAMETLAEMNGWVGLYDLLQACITGSKESMLDAAVASIKRIGSMDAVFGSMMVDLVVGALLPPPVPN